MKEKYTHESEIDVHFSGNNQIELVVIPRDIHTQGDGNEHGHNRYSWYNKGDQ